MAAGYGTSPFFVFSGYDADGRVLPVRRAPLRRAPGPLQGGRARRALVVAALPDDARRVRRELLPGADLELRAGARHGRRRLPPRRHRDREDVRVHRPGCVHRQRRPRDDPAVGDQRRPPRRVQHEDADPRLRRGRRAARRRSTRFPSRAGDRLVFRTAGAGGWGDPLERDPQLVLRDVLRDLVSPEVALARLRRRASTATPSTSAATEAERARLRDARGPVEPFDFGHAPTGGSA